MFSLPMSDTKLTEVSSSKETRREPASERVTLVVQDGDAVNPSTRVVELVDGVPVTLGRSRTCEVVIESERISRNHVTFTRRGSGVEVVDAGSRNGTWVNGVQLSGVRRLVSGDEVVAGSATVLISITSRIAMPIRIESTRYLEERLAAEVDRGVHYKRQFGLALLQVEASPDLADAACDAIANALRPMDVISEYSPGVLAILMPELDAPETEQSARALVAEAIQGESSGALRISVGVASFPEHSTNGGGLISRARAALAEAHRTGDAVGQPPQDLMPELADVIVADPQMVRVYELVRKVAGHPITVLIRGETGVGKEVVAAAIHAASNRRGGPLVCINCASLPETLLESALFGHEKGAFTGAEKRKIGYFEAANGGTLFLDEIGEMTPGLQAKLLRVLEQRKLTRVGGTDEIDVDVRVLCATHRDLDAESKRNAFRADLFFRISGFTILVPSLRQRPDEIEPLARSFIQLGAAAMRRPAPTLSHEALAGLRRYQWPGNVRELRNAIERAMVLHTGGVIDLEDLPDSIRETPMPAPTEVRLGGHRDIRDHIAELERNAIATALDSARGSQTEAAKQLGISRRTLIYRMEKHGLKPLPAKRLTET